jgi:hypothetical protein
LKTDAVETRRHIAEVTASDIAHEVVALSFTLSALRQALRIDWKYVGVLISLWLSLFPIFLIAAQQKKKFVDGLKKLEQRSHKCVELRGEYVQ